MYINNCSIGKRQKTTHSKCNKVCTKLRGCFLVSAASQINLNSALSISTNTFIHIQKNIRLKSLVACSNPPTVQPIIKIN